MNIRPPQPNDSDLARLAELSEKLRHDALSDAEVAELELTLAETPGAREAFAALAMLTAELHHRQGRLALPKVPVEKEGSRRPVPWWAKLTALAACLALAFVLAWQALLPSAGRQARLARSGNAVKSEAGTPASTGRVLATVTRSSGARLLVGNSAVGTGDGVPLGTGRYELRAGVMEASYPSGVALLIEAPATFELCDPKTVRLTAGKISARVPKSAVGFTVETPAANMVDLGTEFGVSVGQTASEVYVFKGQVLVKTANDPEPVHLTENQASRIDRATRTPAGIAPQPEKFIRSLNEPSGGYENEVLRLDPVAYYRMEPMPDPTLLRERVHQRDGKIVFGRSSTPWGPGEVGVALRLGGPEAGAFAVVPDFPISTNNQLSACAWVFAESRPRWASIAKNWAKDAGNDDGGQFHFGLCQDQGDLEVHLRDAAGQEVWVREGTPLPLKEWQFVSFTMDGATIRLYRNGDEVGSAPCLGLSTFAPPVLGIGAKLDRSGTRPEQNTPGFWHGQIDELAIFHQALPPARIKQIFQHAPDRRRLTPDAARRNQTSPPPAPANPGSDNVASPVARSPSPPPDPQVESPSPSPSSRAASPSSHQPYSTPTPTT